jgi:5'-nucleotidase (lipoprotein e(P4) family)
VSAAVSCAVRSSARVPSARPAPLPAAVRWVRGSAEYQGLLRQAYTVATDRLARLTRGLPAGRWGVILDADETVLDNSLYEERRAAAHRAFSDATWAAWVREEAAGALPGAARFADTVHALGGKVVIVTNRADSLCAATRANFRRVGVRADLVVCRKPGEPDKNPRFERVEQGTASAALPPLTVVEWIGDNIEDFPHLTQAARSDPAALSPFGRRSFLVPNPMYGSWDPESSP